MSPAPVKRGLSWWLPRILILALVVSVGKPAVEFWQSMEPGMRVVWGLRAAWVAGLVVAVVLLAWLGLWLSRRGKRR